MTTQIPVDPSKIESELIRLWEGLAKEKMRACLFNLIVFNHRSARTDYIRDIVQKVSEKYPCRVLFISSDSFKSSYLKTSVSVVGNGSIACDYIDISVSGSDINQVPFLILPHIIPDLPVSLLWTEDPSLDHPLFQPLSQMATRIIFDSESADSLLAFSKKVLSLRKETGIDTADLNWARIEGWRELVASLFHSDTKIEIAEMKLTYNSKKTDFFCHLKVQSMYLLAWLSSRLKWSFKQVCSNSTDTFEFIDQKVDFCPSIWDELGPGTLITAEILIRDGHQFHCTRDPKQAHRVTIQISSSEKCQLPYQFLLGKIASGQSLIKEIINKGTSQHYLDMLQQIQILDKDRLC